MDARDRQAFIENTDANYSVIAPAGVGKTQAIVDRIISIASRDDGIATLERLAVVTYTRKAAQEIQVRVREGLLNAGLDSLKVQALNKAFFGTTHSFCLDLIQEYGPHKGLPARFTVLEPQEEGALWERFLQEEAHITDALPGTIREPLLQCIDLWTLLESVLSVPGGEALTGTPFLDSLLTFDETLGYVSGNKRTQAVITRTQLALKDWLERFHAGDACIGLPQDYTGSEPHFSQIWDTAILPLKDWVAHNSLVLAQRIKARFLNYQLEAGVLSYDSLLTLARSLLEDNHARLKIRERNLCVILDEAQDATSEQLEILLGVAGVMDPGLTFLKPGEHSGGRFCMVGDPQQSIYGLGSDLPLYLEVHKKLQSLGWAEALQFRITFRCDVSIVESVNTLFPNVLTSSVRGQVDFETLEPRPGAGKGQVIRLEPSLPEGEVSDRESLFIREAQSIAAWVEQTGLEGLRARSWDNVALLAPRNDWLPILRDAFQRVGFSCQDHTRSAVLADNPAYAWFTALVTVIAEPWNGFELVGVLREIFGIKDTDIATFTHEHGPVSLEQVYRGTGDLYESLALLYALREEALALPLRKAVACIIERVDLSSRLAVLDRYPLHKLLAKLDELLAQASLAEIGGATLGTFAEALRDRLESQDAEVSVQADHIQLVSCHSAKGLQWDAVILPFFNRDIAFAHASYPQIWALDASQPASLVLDKDHKRLRLGEQIRLNQHQELERLLYVATTRAKHSLVFVDDHAFNKTSDGSFASVLKVLPGGANAAHWNQLSQEAVPEETSALPDLGPSLPSDDLPGAQAPFDWATLKAQADSGLKRLTPSGLAHSDDIPLPQQPLVGNGASTGAEYGTFWHAIMETAPWKEGVDAFRDHCMSQMVDSPDPERFEQEVLRFLKSSLASTLLNGDCLITCEMPFLWRSGNAAYEGIIDLVATHKETGAITVVDWKTDLVPEGASTPDFLVEHYQSQIRIYQEALSDWKKRPVEGMLYSTRLGAYASLN